MKRTMAAMALAGALAIGCGGDPEPLTYGPLAEPYDDMALAEGQRVYDGLCATCHGRQGQGASAPSLTGVNQRLTATDQLWVVARGRGQMQAFSNLLTPEEIQAVVAYTRTAFG